MMLRTAILPLGLMLALSSPAMAERGLDVRDLVALDRVSSPTLSPDGRHVVFAKRQVEGEIDKASTGLWVRNLVTRDLRDPHRLTPQGWSVSSPSFSADGSTVFFLSGKSGTQQLYSIPLQGGTPRQLTNFPLDIGSYKLAPQGDRIAFSADVFLECGSDLACTKKRQDEVAANKHSGVIHTQLFVRHWDTWRDGRRSALFVANLPQGKAAAATAATAISTGLGGDVPSKPFGGADEYTWSPDGGSLVAGIRIAGTTEPWSTNFDLYRFVADGSGTPVNLTASNPAWDTGPVFSADGKTLFYRAMKRPGFEADRFGLYALDMATGNSREIAPDWDRSADGLALSADGATLYTATYDMGEHPLFAVDIASGMATKLVGDGTISSFQVAGDTLAFTRNSLKTGDQVFVTTTQGGPLRAITPAAGDLLPDVVFGDYEQYAFKGWNGATVHGYVLKPWNYEEGKTYPVAFLIHGGPQGSFGNGWSNRWNPQTYAGQGYAVVMIDFHGSTGYGQAFIDAISQHWGDRPLEDLQKGWAAAQAQYPFLDGDKACALGASYGGYMVNWIAGQWNEPWKCLVNHNGVFDTRSMGLVTEELWFTEWEFGGTVAANPQGYEKFNPARHIDKWRVPMLVVAGQRDYRVPLDQSLSTFTALQRQGIESKLLYFPDENHWVLKPHNSVLWHDTVNAWLKQHIGQ